MFSRVCKRRFRFNIAWETGNTIVTKCYNSGKGGKEGIQKISKTWAVRCKLQVLRVLIQNIDTLDFRCNQAISICARKLTYLKKCIIPRKMKMKNRCQL